MRSPRREHALFLLFGCLLLLLLFRDAVLHGYVLGQGELLLQFPPWRDDAPPGWQPGNALIGDSPIVFYPFLVHAREALWNGELPVWTNRIGAGLPFLATFQSAIFSPFTVPGYLLPLPHALTVIAALKLLAGGAGMFAFLRLERLSIAAAAFGGTAYLLNAFSVVWLEHPLSAVAAWLPWLLLAAGRVARSASARNVALLAGFTAAAVLAGHPETLFKMMLLVGPYAVYRAAGSERPLRGALAAAGGVLVGTLIAAVQIVPFLEYVSDSRILATRSTASLPLFTIPAAGFATAFVPDFFGNPTSRRYVLAGANYCEQQMYPGIATWLLAASSLAASRHRRPAIFFLAAAVAGALIMYGTSLANVAVAILPPLRVAALSRFGLLTITGLIVAAAFACDRLLPDDDSPSRRERFRILLVATVSGVAIAVVVFAFLSAQRPLLEEARQLVPTTRSVNQALTLVVAAVAVMWLLPLLSRAAAVSLLVGIIAVDLFLFADGFHPLKPTATTFPPVPQLEPVREDRTIFRVAGWGDTFIPNSALVYGVDDYRGYDGIGMRRYGELLEVAFRFNGSFHQLVNFSAPHLLDFLNIKYILVPETVEVPSDRFTIVREGRTRVYRNERVLPRAFLVDRFIVLQGNAARRALRDGTVDVRRTVVLDGPPTLVPAPASFEHEMGSAVISEYQRHRVTIETRAGGDRLLVLSDTDYPGWIATVDGQRVPILNANFAFRAVSIPAGAHVVEFHYRPRSLALGLSGTGVGLLIAGVLAFKRRRPTQVS